MSQPLWNVKDVTVTLSPSQVAIIRVAIGKAVSEWGRQTSNAKLAEGVLAECRAILALLEARGS